MNQERIEREIGWLLSGQQDCQLIIGEKSFVIYRNVPTDGQRLGLPDSTDVIVPVPAGYPASPIDLAGLPVGSAFIPLVKGGQNNQGVHVVGCQQWQLASYHPHNGGGGPPWDQTRHGFHTYFDHLLAWLHRLG